MFLSLKRNTNWLLGPSRKKTRNENILILQAARKPRNLFKHPSFISAQNQLALNVHMLQNFIWNKNIYKAENKHSCTLAHPPNQPTNLSPHAHGLIFISFALSVREAFPHALGALMQLSHRLSTTPLAD